MKKLSLLIAAISLFTTAAEARPNVSHNVEHTEGYNGSKTTNRTTTIENGDIAVSRDVEREYDPEDKSVTSNRTTEINKSSSKGYSSVTINHSTERKKNANGSITVTSDADISKNGAPKATTTVTREIEPNTNTGTITSTRTIDGSKSVTREINPEKVKQDSGKSSTSKSGQ